MKINRPTLAFCVLAVAASAQAAVLTVTDICPNFNEVMSRSSYPPEALKRGIVSGEVTVTFTLTADNQTTDIAAAGASDPILENWATGIVKQLHCKSGGQEQRLSLPFSYRIDGGSSYAATRDDIPSSSLRDIVPRIAELKVTPDALSVKVGDGVNIDALKVLAYDKDGNVLGRLRQFDRGAQPKNVLAMRGAGIVQALSAGVGYIELTAPLTVWKRTGNGKQPPTVRVQVSVSE